MTGGKTKGIVLAPILRQHYRPLNAEERHVYIEKHPDIEWHFVEKDLPKKPNGLPDWEQLCDMYVAIINEKGIQVALGSTSDDSGMVHAYVSENCPKLKGPSMESIVLCNHKIYCRQYIIPEELNLRYYPMDIDVDINIEEVIRHCGLPLILKPACEAASTLVKVIRSAEQFCEALNDYRALMAGSYYDKFGKVLMGLEEKYPLLAKRAILAEEFVDITADQCDVQTVEIGAYKGEPIPWVICDNIYWRKHPQCFLACATPPVLTQEHQDVIWKNAKKVVYAMIAKGFRNSLMNIETFTWLSGKVKVMEINPRLAYQCTPLYTSIYQGGDNVEAMVHMQQGKHVVSPKSMHDMGIEGAPRYALNNYIATIKGGIAREIYDYQKAKEYQEANKHRRWDMIFLPPDRILRDDVQPFYCFGWSYVTGDSFMDCQSQIRKVSMDLFPINHHSSLWDDDYDWPAYYKMKLEAYRKRNCNV